MPPIPQGEDMARTTSATSTKERLNKGQIAKMVEDTAKKVAKKESAKVAKSEASKIAAKVATEASLNPDFELNDEEDFKKSLSTSHDHWNDEDEDDDLEEHDSGFLRRPSRLGLINTEEHPEEENDLSKDVTNRDIFAYATDLMNKGTPVRLQIKKNGQFLTTIKKPYSEEQLQKDYGEGHYAVILRNDVKGTFIKQQSFSIAAPPMTVNSEIIKIQQEKQEEKIDKMFNTFSQMQAAQTDSQQQLFERLMEEQRRREEEEKERRREERELMRQQENNNTNVLATVLQAALTPKHDDSGSNMTAILQVLQSQQNQTTQMIMESNKNFMMMIQEMRRDSQLMMEKLTQMTNEQAREFRQQLTEMSKKKDDGFNAIEMFKMLNDSRESGMEFGLKINDLAKQIAESDIAPAQPKSIVESVLDNLGKFAPLMLSAAQNSNASQQFTQNTPQVVTKPTLVPAPTPQSYKKPSQTTSNPIVATPRPVTAVPKTAIQKVEPKKTVTQTTIAPSSEHGKIVDDVKLKEKIIDLCVPLIAHALQNGITSGGLGDASINTFNQHGITLPKVISLVSVEDIYDLAFKKYTLPDLPEIRNYLKDYYDYLQLKASTQKFGETT